MVLTVVWKAIRYLAEIIGRMIYYFGLYVPILYLFYGLALRLIFTDFRPFSATTDGRLFIFGFALTVIAAVIISVHNLIVKPFRKHVSKQNVVEYEGKQGKNAPEAPKIYESKVNKGIIVYEYSNRYDLYEEYRDGLHLVATEFKKKKGRRW